MANQRNNTTRKVGRPRIQRAPVQAAKPVQAEPQIEAAQPEANRTPRAIETREADTRPTDGWFDSTKLPAPNPIDGYDIRYIRTATLGQADIANVSQKFREGWEPILASEVPEIKVMCDIDSRWPDCVEIGGQLLCKIPTEVADRRRAHFDGIAQLQIDTIDQHLQRESDPRMPVLRTENKTRTTFGEG